MEKLSRLRLGRAGSWLRDHDPELAATRRAGRTAIVMPALFALCSQVIGSPTMATFAAFGSFSMLLLVDFTGSMVQRLRAHLGLAVAWAALICLGTLVADETWLAVAVMVVIGFLVLFSGVVSSVLAGASTALLLALILPVTSPVPFSELPDRLAGAGLAAAASMLAITLLWPRPAADPLSAPAARVCRAAAEQLRTDASLLTGGPGAPSTGQCRAAADEASTAADDLRTVFDATPYRPTGLSTSSRAIVRLVDELTWLCGILTDSAPSLDGNPQCDAEAQSVRRAAASVLDEAATLLDAPHGSPDELHAASENLRTAMADMERNATTRLPMDQGGAGTPSHVHPVIGALDLSFRAQELGFATLQIAGNVDLAVAAERRSWFERVLGREPGAATEPLASARERAAAHLQPQSVWLHNSLRGAVGLGIAVALANLTGVQHSFWVLLGTLSVLRSNALNTGQNAARALGGTVAGSIIGTVLLQIIGHHGTVLWFLLPIAVLLAGIAPAAISFAAGQASFTITLVILFNIGQDPDWHIVLLRIQDIAIGCAVSVLVGLFFWPRGATAAVDRALAEAYRDSARYLAGAVEYAVGRCGAAPASAEVALQDRLEAAAAARRLDDAFRSYLAERGSKPVPLAEMTTLVTGIVGLRLAADAVLGLWQRAGEQQAEPDRSDARLVLLGAVGRVSGWYRDLAAGLGQDTPVRDPLPRNPVAEAELVESLRRELSDEHGQATDTAVRIIWTADHLDAARRLQPGLAAAAGAGKPS
ncbi:putative membrane protein YccC [Streptomyces phaeochromogenes]|uniref:FUSC family protein n=1 Tax=Streptomyces phaeochromogenes TaxID=1923 RepID=UPI00278D4D77|nr:FUSC family protein [Streptomyces phaeochromogenes]MDQ0946963.1 putative membrane protein YccC [Streptomyces phaeochromogenes]